MLEVCVVQKLLLTVEERDALLQEQLRGEGVNQEEGVEVVSGLRPVNRGEAPMEKTNPGSPWQIWVSPEQKIVSFHQEAGFQKQEFRSWELFLRCVDRYTGEQYRYQ